MNRLIEYSNKFRILKGGKISLVVSALVLGSVLNAADFTVTGITNIDPNSSATMVDATNNVTINSNVNITDETANYILYINDSSNNTYNITNNADFRINNTATSAEPALTTMYLRKNSSFNITNNGVIAVHGTNGNGAYGIYSSDSYDTSTFTLINNKGIEVRNTMIAGGVYLYKTGNININNNSSIDVVSSQHHADAITILANYGDINLNITNTKDASISARGGINSYAISITETNTTTGTIQNVGVISGLNSLAELDRYSFSIFDRSSTNNAIFNNRISTIDETTYIGTLEGNISWYGTLNNEGKISLPHNALQDDSARISYFTNKSTGILEIGLQTDGTTTTYSQLNTTNATFEDGSTINVNVLYASTNVGLLIGQTLSNVVNASNALTINGTLNITDNSAMLDFEYKKNENSLDLIAIAAPVETTTQTPSNTGYEAHGIAGGRTNPSKKIGRELDVIVANGDSEKIATILTKINSLATDEQVATALDDLMPTTVKDATINASNQIASNVQSIVELRQNLTMDSGFNSGDEMFTDKNMWFKPFGSYAVQNDKDGSYGFNMKAYGFGLGSDAQYKDSQFGIGLFYTNANVDVNNVTQTADIDAFTVLLYGNTPVIDDKTNFMYQVGYSLQDTKMNNPYTTSDFTGKSATVDLKLTRQYKVNDKVVLRPIVEANYRNFKTPSYSDGLTTVDKSSHNELIASVGTIVDYKLDKKSKLFGNINVGYDLLDENQSTSFTGLSGAQYSSSGIDNGRWEGRVGIGYETTLDDKGSLLNFAFDHKQQGSDFRNDAISAKYVFKF